MPSADRSRLGMAGSMGDVSAAGDHASSEAGQHVHVIFTVN
ncbi:hypothetical protein [Nocardia sp. NPDC059239]